LKEGRAWSEVFPVLNENNFNPRILYLLGTSHDPGLGIIEFAQPLHVGVCTASSTIISLVPGVFTFVLTSP
jgi:hypothetical protein